MRHDKRTAIAKIQKLRKKSNSKPDTKSNVVLQTSGDRFHYGVSYTAPPHSLVRWTFWFDVRYGRHVLHIISIPVRFGTFMKNDASRKNRNEILSVFELRNIHTGTKISARCSAECHYCLWLDSFDTTLCYSVCEGRMECWCCIFGVLVWRSLVAEGTIQFLFVICHARLIHNRMRWAGHVERMVEERCV